VSWLIVLLGFSAVLLLVAGSLWVVVQTLADTAPRKENPGKVLTLPQRGV